MNKDHAAAGLSSSVVEDGTRRSDEDKNKAYSQSDDDDMTEIRQALSRRQPFHSTEDDPLDPIEWTVRKLIPIPETYYWDYTPSLSNHSYSSSSSSNWQAKLPWRLKAWHRVIGAADAAIHWTDRWIAQPVASATGLSAPRMSYVTDHMTDEEWEAARERLRGQKERRLIQQDGSDMVVVTKNQKGKLVPEQFLEMESNEIPVEER